MLKERSSDKDLNFGEATSLQSTAGNLVGEDAAQFALSEQDIKSWGYFFVAVGSVLGFLFYVWLYDQGPHLGDQVSYSATN